MADRIAWIDTVSEDAADERLARLYRRIRGPNGDIDNIMQAHSLRPHTMEGHLALYKATLHHARNRIDRAFLETVGIQVSLLNRCAYCVEHHLAGLRRLLDDDDRASAVRDALAADAPDRAFEGRELAALHYVRTLTTEPHAVTEASLDAMREAGFDDGEILEINQVAAYFAYANRTVLGLGVSTDGDVLGLSPNQVDDPDDWRHG